MERLYKDSGIKWIGRIPKDWKTCSFSNAILRMATGLNPRDNFILTNDDEYYYVTIRNFKDGKLFLDENCDRISPEAWEIIQVRSQLHKGDILFASISKDGQAYLLNNEPKNWNINESVFCIRVNKTLFNNGYFYYHIIDEGFHKELRMDATGATFQSIKQNKLRKSVMCLPPISEQQLIAKYLDEKCGEIDRLITLQEQMIVQLTDYKQSVITEAVTKGINPNAHLIPSGIDWIGGIPEHWEMQRLKTLGWTQNGISQSGDYFGEDYAYPFVSYSDAYKNYSIPYPEGRANSSDKDRKTYSLVEGDVLFTRTSETIEEIGFSSTCLETIKDAVYSGFLIRFRPTSNKLYKGFSKYYFRSQVHRAYFVKQMNIVTRASLGQDLLKNLVVLLPPLAEQHAIAEHLDIKCGEIDRLIEIKRQKIDTLKEYKKSVIYEAVTGKTDLRDS